MPGGQYQRRRGRAAALVSVLAVVLGLPGVATSAGAATAVPVGGAGSTFAQKMLEQWSSDVRQSGVRVDYRGAGAAEGRQRFEAGTADFAVTEIPYGFGDAGASERPPAREFAYLPILAGGTALMYNLKAGGERITDLRLSGENLAKIFTGVLTRWDDPLLTADNPGRALPSRPIVPVVRSDSAGTTAEFTRWIAAQHPEIWDAYCQKLGRRTPCGPTSTFPHKAPFFSFWGSSGVVGHVGRDANEGTITYVENSYARNARMPVVKLSNKAGYFVGPEWGNVAIALRGATVGTDLTSNLEGVYGNADPRAYPLSSYSYMVVPTSLDRPMTTGKGYTLGKYAGYAACQGQQTAADRGYSPLPKNLVASALDAARRIPGADAADLDLARCASPTFAPDGTDLLDAAVPMPIDCDRFGMAQCPVDGPSPSPTTGPSPSPTGPSPSPTTSPSPSPSPSPGSSPVVATESLPAGKVGLGYFARLRASGGTTPYSWSVRSGTLPAGIDVFAAGLIGGVPEEPGVHSLVLEVTDATGALATKTLTVTIAGGALEIVVPLVPAPKFGQEYSAALSVPGGRAPIGWKVAAGSLPPGLVLSSAGTVSGKPSAVGTWSVTVNATDADGGSAVAVLPLVVTATLDSAVSAVTATDLRYSYRPGCPVKPADLRRLELNHWGLDRLPYRGTLVVRASAADALTRVFGKAFDAKFPVRSMNPVEMYEGSDEKAMTVGNTSVFNCRHVTGNPTRLSQHAYGDSIDINTIENPYVTAGNVYPAAATGYLKRTPYRRGMILSSGSVARAFAAEGWFWGARWKYPDYQHFSRNGR